MGFINWNGERDDSKARYEELKEYAQMVEDEERAKYFQEKIAVFATQICKTPEMLGLSREDTIKVLVAEFKELKDMYDIFVRNKDFSWEYDLWLPFRDMWVYTLSAIIFTSDDTVDSAKKEKIFNTFIKKILKLEGQISREEYVKNSNENAEYVAYMQQSFELSKYDSIYFWKWIGYLSKDIQVDNVAKDFADDFYTLLSRIIFFINVLLGSTDFGIRYVVNKDDIIKNIYNELKDCNNLNKITSHIVNPVYARKRNVDKAVEYKNIKNSKLKEWEEKNKTNYNKTSKVYEESDVRLETNRNETKHDSYDKIRLDKDYIKSLIEKRTLLDFAEVYNILVACKLPEEMTQICRMISEEINILQEAIEKFKDIYQVDLDQFYDYYMPESIALISTYVDYINARVDDKIISEAKTEVMDSSQQLLIAIVDMKNELYKFGSMELKARSQALESMMNQDGHINPEYRINND